MPLLPATAAAKTFSWNQKLTVEVETPEGIKIGSSVMQARLTDKSGLFVTPEAGGATFDLRGEAVFMEVQPGKYLFALLKNMPRPYGLFYPNDTPFEAAPKLEDTKADMTATLIPSDYPMLVTFTDINDPTSVKQVKPDNLAEYFGPGVSLKSLTMTITAEQTSTGKVAGVLNWLGSYPEPKLGPATGKSSDLPFYRKIAHGDFIRR